MQVGFTKYIPMGELVGKRFSRNPDGSVRKDSQGVFSKGRFETIECAWKEFGAVLQNLTPRTPLSYGVCSKTTAAGLPLQRGRITSAKYEQTQIARGNELYDLVSRTKRNFKWHEPPCEKSNVLFLDIDDFDVLGIDLKGDAEDQIEQVTELILKLFPELTALRGGCWAFASAGAFVYDTQTNDWFTQLSGLHLYFPMPNFIPVDDLKAWFMAKSWLNETAFFKITEHENGGKAMYERGLLDFTVWQSQRLDFIGGSECQDGLEQRRPAPIFFDIEEEECDGVFGVLTQEELSLAESLRAEAHRKADNEVSEWNQDLLKNAEDLDRKGENRGLSAVQLRKIFEGELPSTLRVQLDNGDLVPVWKLIFFPERYAGKSMHDPLSPEKGKCKAKFYYNPDNDPGSRYVINSFVNHERRFFLHCDVEGIEEMLRMEDLDTLKKRLSEDPTWLEELGRLHGETEYTAILDAISEVKLLPRKQLESKIERQINPDKESKKAEILEQVNERFAFVTLNGRPRYVEERGIGNHQEIIFHIEDSIKSILRNWGKITSWDPSKGKFCTKPCYDAWMEWKGRREYDDVRFEPGRNEKEFTEIRNNIERKILNRFRGFTVNPANGRGCDLKTCEGKGCFRWFFENGGNKVCSAGWETGWDPAWERFSGEESVVTGECVSREAAASNCTFWLKTIHEVFCNKNLEHTRWVVDWFTDIIAFPGGHGSSGRRSEISLGVRGGQGTGKSAVVYPIKEILGRYADTISGKSRLSERFNASMEDLLLLHAEEAFNYATKAEASVLKDIITGETLKIERKGIDSHQARNWIRVVLTTNSDRIISAEEDERRFTIFDAIPRYKKNKRWFKRVKTMDCAALLLEMLEWEIESNLDVNLNTDALIDQQELSQDVVDEFICLAVEESWFWNEEGYGIDVANSVLSELYDEHFSRTYKMTPESFKKRLFKKLREKGLRVSKSKVLLGGVRTNGVTLSSIEQFIQAFPVLRRRYSDG